MFQFGRPFRTVSWLHIGVSEAEFTSIAYVEEFGKYSILSEHRYIKFVFAHYLRTPPAIPARSIVVQMLPQECPAVAEPLHRDSAQFDHDCPVLAILAECGLGPNLAELGRAHATC